MFSHCPFEFVQRQLSLPCHCIKIYQVTWHHRSLLGNKKSSLSFHKHNSNPKPPVPANNKNFKQELLLNFFHPCWSGWLILNSPSPYRFPAGCWHPWMGLQSREKKDKKDNCMLLGPDNCLKPTLSEHMSVFSRGDSAGTLQLQFPDMGSASP